jgi:hypothetical protein
MSIKRALRMIETVPSGEGQEVEILHQFVRDMLEYPVEKLPRVTGRTRKADFVELLVGGPELHRHVSSHGNGQGLYLHGRRGTVVRAEDLQRGCQGKPLKGRFLTVSACGEPTVDYWNSLHECSGVEAIIAPMAAVSFSDSALFYMAFYFALFRLPDARDKKETPERLSDFIDTFQRVKSSFLGLGGRGAFRLLFWSSGTLREIV